MRDIAIIGSGIVGASIAYHISEISDHSVTVYERQSPASETTYKSMAMFGLYGDQVQYEMKQYGLKLYNEFFQSPTANPRYHYMGLLRAATTEAGADELRDLTTSTQRTKGTNTLAGTDRDPTMYLEPDELPRHLVLPPLETDSIEGALFRPICGYMQPQELAYEFINRATENGVAIETNTTVTDIHVKNNTVTGIELNGSSDVVVDEVVCAAGPWNHKIAEKVGLDIPVKHTLAPILELDPDELADHTLPSLSHHESPYSFYRQTTRSEDSIFVGYNPGGYHDSGTIYDPNTYGEEVPKEIKDNALDIVELLLPEFASAPIRDEWVGIRSVTPDGNPILGWTELEGFNVAAFNTSGIQLAPAAGKLIAEQIVRDEPTELYDGLSISRFHGYTDYIDS